MQKQTYQFSFEQLRVWQESMNWVIRIYQLTEKFPKTEIYGLISQIRRAAISIPLNIAEGKGRYYHKEFIQFLYNSRGSLFETITCLELSVRLGYLKKQEIQKEINQAHLIHRQIEALIASIKKQNKK